MTVPNDARKYRQPRRINAVSVTLLFLVLLAGYAALAIWPVITLNADVKSALEDALPRLYRANLLPDAESSIASEEIRQALIEKLTTLDIPDPGSTLIITRNAHIVAIAVKVAAAIDLKLIGKKIPLTLNPRAETSAERVSY